MQNLIYYPSFEPESETWLKYALIYIDEFSPIIPPTGKKEVSDLFKQVRDETNLVRIVEPKNEDGWDATRKAINEIELILGNRSAYKNIFKDPSPSVTWGNKNNWSTVLYREKFNDEFERFCLDRGFGVSHDRGILLSPELGSLFMTFLAESIAYRRQATPITDNSVLDNLSTYLRTKDITTGEVLKSAQIVVKTKLPRAIETISLKKIIDFRNREGITELRASFNSTLEKFYESVENDFNPIGYIDFIKKTNKEFIFEMGKYLGELTVAALGAFLILNSSKSSNLDIIKEVGQGLLTLGGIYGVNQAWKLNEDRRNARKFLSKVRSI